MTVPKQVAQVVRRLHGLKAAIAAFCLVLVAATWFATFQRIGFERVQTKSKEDIALSNLAIAFEENAIRTLRDADQVLSLVKHEYEKRGPDVDIAALIKAGNFDQSLFTFVAIVDNDGNVTRGIAPTGLVNVSDRDYFRAHVKRDDGTIFVGVPLLGRITGKWAIPISRRLNRQDGSFGGVVYMAVDPTYFAKFYGRADLGVDGLVTLVGLDGIVRVRQAGRVTTFGEDMNHSTLLERARKEQVGTFISKGRLEGIPRFYSYRILPEYPLVVALGRSEAVVMSGFNARERAYLYAAIAITLFVLLGGSAVIALLTQQRRALGELRESDERFKSLVEQSITGIYIIQDGAFTYVNPRLAEIVGSNPSELIGKSVEELVPRKVRALVRDKIKHRIDGSEKTSQYTLTLKRKDGSTVDVGIHSAQATFEGKPAIIGMMQDITERKVAEENAKRYLAQIESSLVGTIEAVSNMVELRDPYTAGHERRVGDIAAAIGMEMGLPQDQIKGLHLIGHVHDIGKIAIPAEILSKPGKLSKIEFELIRCHPQQGYDILKGIEFPWPVARAILEHHERLDGSGYPKGLKGDEILLEARILAVADTVEAMSAHRPYRPGLGMDAALQEIESQSGKRYDPRVAAACLRLFREKSFSAEATVAKVVDRRAIDLRS